MGIIYPLAEFGEKGELWVAGELRRRGYVVEWIGRNSDYDLLLGGCARVEVKSAMLTRDLRRGYQWQFSLRRHGLLVDEDVLFLLCWEDLENGPLVTFVVPGGAVDARLTKIAITSRDPRTYRGRWARYREDWGQVRRVVERLPPAQQPALFREQVQKIIPF